MLEGSIIKNLDFCDEENNHWDDSIDDITLSQVCSTVEKQESMFDDMDSLTLTYKGGLHQRKIDAKNIKHYIQSESLFEVYREYITVIGELGGKDFYRRPLVGKGKKFGVQPIGINKLSSIMKTMCTDAGFESHFTNHSGKRTCAITLYQAGVPEQEIMRRTGHRSVESVRKYKRPSDQMLKDISNILEPNSSSKMKCEISGINDNCSPPKIKCIFDGQENQENRPSRSASDVVFNSCV